VGRTSMKIRIEVMAWCDSGAIRVKVTEGLFTFVAIDDEARPRPVAGGS
jgi:acyl-CoA thioesterase YciA